MKGARSDLFPYTSTPNAILTMYRVEGMGSFYKGNTLSHSIFT